MFSHVESSASESEASIWDTSVARVVLQRVLVEESGRRVNGRKVVRGIWSRKRGKTKAHLSQDGSDTTTLGVIMGTCIVVHGHGNHSKIGGEFLTSAECA